MILIVDDDKSVRLSINLALTRAGFECVEASTEDSAMAAVRSISLRLVILDMNLTPSSTGTQGIEMLRKIKILAPALPVILISAWGTIPLAVEGMSRGAADFLSKPWSNRDLVAKARAAIDAASEAAERENLVDTLDNVERDTILKALRAADGNLTAAARTLGITRQALYRRLEKYGLADQHQ